MHSRTITSWNYRMIMETLWDTLLITAIKLFDLLMDQYVQPEDVADQVTVLHKILKQNYNPNEKPQVQSVLQTGTRCKEHS